LLSESVKRVWQEKVHVGGRELTMQEYFESLMPDPAHGHKITMKSIDEAIAGLAAEKKGFIPGPLRRDPTGAAEFIDAGGQAWDVKVGISRAPNGKYIFDPKHLMDGINMNLKCGENVILDLTKLEEADFPILYDHVLKYIPRVDYKKIIVAMAKDQVLSLE